MKKTIEVEILSIEDGERVTIIPSGFETYKLAVFEDYAYNLSVVYLHDEMYEQLKRRSVDLEEI